MPIYEYECNNCHCVFERLVFASDEERPSCPHCTTTNVTKRISCVGYISASGSGSSASSCSSSAATRGFS
ncbi:MAG: zinc ribbon domain-containing protein [Thermodesulfobacteriota bacterium]